MFYEATESPEPVLAFSSFRFYPTRRMLYDEGRPIRLGSRAIDILHVLLERAGETVTKDQLIARAWPDTIVEEGNLRVHVAALRKTLGGRHIESVVGRGYCFTAPVVRGGAGAPPSTPPGGDAAQVVYLPQGEGLPPQPTRVFGREHTVAALAEQLAERRFVTITGTGGIGKTTVALATAEHMQPQWRQGVVFVDLAPLTDASQVPRALAAALVMENPERADLAAIIGALRSHHLLLILDSCEHLLEPVSLLAERMLQGAQGVRLLATSREPLRAEGEWVHRLQVLEQPPESGAAGMTLARALAYPAAQLFAERVQASAAGVRLDDADVPQIVEICRRLDGIPLAIELAAARVELFGVRGLAVRLDDCCQLLKGGRRTAKARHRTLEATLDWSYALLGERERRMLHRLSVFRRRFTLEEALHIGADHGGGMEAAMEQAMEALSNLVSKSMLATVADTGAARYRLLETTRAYAAAKLAESGEHDAVLARYAALMGA
ncbi:ATP-binding protein [Pseudoduganella namucuonensis]|uniref:Predicted ATPase n=1 Tax=Pseudoduganella namucuonensis TaxID=1035707 RepID=A0A1I7IA95_9BURK|nr:winged helix-turn-helix domain-containing protein [Pseudoduganella namucuonensis]SFU69913.1 Predicted ATPase [Pseudoduganella namucuonensis]